MAGTVWNIFVGTTTAVAWVFAGCVCVLLVVSLVATTMERLGRGRGKGAERLAAVREAHLADLRSMGERQVHMASIVGGYHEACKILDEVLRKTHDVSDGVTSSGALVPLTIISLRGTSKEFHEDFDRLNALLAEARQGREKLVDELCEIRRKDVQAAVRPIVEAIVGNLGGREHDGH